MDNGDKALLIRIDERVKALQDNVAELTHGLHSCQEAIVRLRIESAKYGALAGIVASVLVALAIAGITAVRAAG